MTAYKVVRHHPAVQDVAYMAEEDLWAYALGELDFLATPEQKRIPAALLAAVRELFVRANR